jgi:hypothetical protein
MVRVDEELSAGLLERADRDQAAHMSLRPGHWVEDWDTVVEAVDRDNTARLREMVGQHGWPGHRLASVAGAHAAWLLAGAGRLAVHHDVHPDSGPLRVTGGSYRGDRDQAGGCRPDPGLGDVVAGCSIGSGAPLSAGHTGGS